MSAFKQYDASLDHLSQNADVVGGVEEKEQAQPCDQPS